MNASSLKWIVEIDRSARDIFELLADPSRDQQWKSTAKSCLELADSPSGRPRYELLHRPLILGRLVNTMIELVGSDAPRWIEWRYVDDQADATVRYELVPAGARTQFIQHRQVAWLVPSWLQPAARHLLWRSVRSDMWALKRSLEAGSTT